MLALERQWHDQSVLDPSGAEMTLGAASQELARIEPDLRRLREQQDAAIRELGALLELARRSASND